MSVATFLGFLLACWAISLAPGPGAVASMSSGMRYGLRHGYWTAVGLQAGLLLQIAVVAVGLGALLATSAPAFETVRWFGVAYLLYLGFGHWRAARPLCSADGAGAPPETPRTLAWKAFLINTSNPKATVFMLAVLPQFVDPHAPLWPQYLIIAATMVSVDLVVMFGYTLLAARLHRYLGAARHRHVVGRLFGGLFIAAAAYLALARSASR